MHGSIPPYRRITWRISEEYNQVCNKYSKCKSWSNFLLSTFCFVKKWSCQEDVGWQLDSASGKSRHSGSWNTHCSGDYLLGVRRRNVGWRACLKRWPWLEFLKQLVFYNVDKFYFKFNFDSKFTKSKYQTIMHGTTTKDFVSQWNRKKKGGQNPTARGSNNLFLQLPHFIRTSKIVKNLKTQILLRYPT